MPQTFLTARWRKLIMANYVVPPALLQPLLPAHTELDFYKGSCFVSLVGFMFADTRLRGVRVPGHVHFEEVNLRFYVRHSGPDGSRRGVVFVKELVPRAALSFVANTFYGEHYETVPMRHKLRESAAGLVVAYRWKKGGWHKLQVSASPIAAAIAEGSEEEFITEHYWGYTKLGAGRSSEYEVVHPRWMIYPVRRYAIEVDFGLLYGAPFRLLNDAAPASVLLAEGSEVTVRSGAAIRL